MTAQTNPAALADRIAQFRATNRAAQLRAEFRGYRVASGMSPKALRKPA